MGSNFVFVQYGVVICNDAYEMGCFSLDDILVVWMLGIFLFEMGSKVTTIDCCSRASSATLIFPPSRPRAHSKQFMRQKPIQALLRDRRRERHRAKGGRSQHTSRSGLYSRRRINNDASHEGVAEKRRQKDTVLLLKESCVGTKRGRPFIPNKRK